MEMIVEYRFDEFFDEQKKIGILFNAFMYHIGIKKDNNYAGDEVSRNPPAKSWQRAKYLSNNYQHTLQADKIHAV